MSEGSKTKELWSNPEYRERMSKAHLGNRQSEETKRKISNTEKGRFFSKEHRDKLSKAQTGKKVSEETKKKLSLINQGKQTGSKCHFWQGGKSYEPYTIDWRLSLKRSIRERDKYTCQLCKEPQGDEALSVHHIDYDKKNCNPINLVSLCRLCHQKTNFNRNYWTKYFNNRV